MTLKVGNNIDGWCTRCKLVLTHTIEATAGGKVARVQCNTCRGQHAYRARAPGVRAVGAVRTRGTSAGAGTSNEQKTKPSEYAMLLRGRGTSAARPYTVSERYKVSELIAHATFGLGAVTAERDNVKIDVLFADGPRVLVHGR